MKKKIENNLTADSSPTIKAKTLYIIPGFKESTNDIGYQKIIKYARKKGFEVIFFNPKWGKTIKVWLKNFNELIEKKNRDNVMVLGFSFGAYIAVLSAINHNFKKLILCSLSPYFKDDITKLPPLAYKMLGKKRIKDFSENKFPININTSAVFLVGDKDTQLVIQRVKKSYKKWIGSKEIKILKNVRHDINNDLYLEAIKLSL